MFNLTDIPAIISRWFHIGAVIIAIGGTVFLRFVLHQAASRTLPEREHAAFTSALLARWSRVLHICITVILLSGTYNAVVMLGRHKSQPVYHGLLGTKILLALILFFFAIAITGRSRAFAGLREHRAKWMTVNIAIAGTIVLLSNVLKYLPLSF